jgi:hypothetical protein
MTKRQFDSIVKKAINYGNKYKKEMAKLELWCNDKYGYNWSDLDCDYIIDNLEFGAGMLTPITFSEFKESIESKL